MPWRRLMSCASNSSLDIRRDRAKGAPPQDAKRKKTPRVSFHDRRSCCRFIRPSIRLASGHTTVYDNGAAGHKRRVIRGQENGGARDLSWLSLPADGLPF